MGSPYELKKFKKNMQRGLGRCNIILENADDIEKYRETVLWGCLNNFSYDLQCESSRAEYAYQLQSNFGDRYFLEKIIDRFQSKRLTWHNFIHLADLLLCFAKNGSKEASEQLFSKYQEMKLRIKSEKDHFKQLRIAEKFDPLCCNIVELEGFKRFKKIYLDLNDFVNQTPKTEHLKEMLYLDGLFCYGETKFGKNRVKDFFEEAISANGDTSGYFSMFIVAPENSSSISNKKVTLSQLVSEFAENKQNRTSKAFLFAKSASEEELISLAKLLTSKNSEYDEEDKADFLKVFSKRDFPLDFKILIDLSRSENNDLSFASFCALERLGHSDLKERERNEISSYAAGLLEQDVKNYSATFLLAAFYSKKHENIFLKSVKSLKVGYASSEWHIVFNSVLDLLNKNKNVPDELCNYIYENSLCSCYRKRAVAEMVKRKLVTDEIVKECLYDSDKEIRKLAEKRAL